MVYEENGIVFEDEIVDIAKMMSDKKMWKPRVEEVGWDESFAQRKAKFEEWHSLFNQFYNRRVELRWGTITEASDKMPGSSGLSGYVKSDNPMLPSDDGIIIMVGRLSVITFLHEWAHALGMEQDSANAWALGLFKLAFPASFNNLQPYGGVMVRSSETDPVGDSDDLPPLE